MTLRARLTGAFLAVVLGPVLLGAVFVGVTATTVSRDRSVERLDLAASAIRTSIGALCRQLHTVGESIAVDVAAERAAAVYAVHITDSAGSPVATTPGAPPPPWADCAEPARDTSGIWRYEAIAARVEIHDATNRTVGAVYVAQRLDLPVLRRLAQASGAAVTLLGAPGAALSTEPSPAGVVAAVATLRPGRTGTSTQRYVRRDGPVADQPLPLALSVPRADMSGLYGVLVGVVLVTVLLAVLAAWWLARSTTRPLAEVAAAADRVAGGDLAARVPVHRDDEVGRLGTAFNRMTRETQSYVHALTASRDQLRGHLAVLGDTLASTHDLSRILRVLLQTAMAATGARAGVVLLADPSTGVLIGQCTAGLPDGDIRVAIGRGLLGGVATTREARRGRIDRDGPALAEAEPRCETYVAVPFLSTRRTGAGVLALYDRLGRDEFDDADLVTLRTFAGQAAIAVDNVLVHEEAQRLSVTDPLTGLLNYRSLAESLRREVERAHRFGRMLGVLALDLDRFKEINDSYGHAAGDSVLAEFARRIRTEVREVDLAFRQGGEEFVVLLPETDAAGASVVAERLCTIIRSAPVAVGARLIPVTVSIGIAVYPDHGDTGSRVLEAADDALYVAKAAGRDAYSLARRPAAVPVNGEPQTARLATIQPQAAPGGAADQPARLATIQPQAAPGGAAAPQGAPGGAADQPAHHAAAQSQAARRGGEPQAPRQSRAR